MNFADWRRKVLLHTHRALQGEIIPAMRGICCSWTERNITVRVIFDGEITELGEDCVSMIETELIADFTMQGVAIEMQAIRWDTPESLNSILLENGEWLYIRREYDW